LYSFQQQQNLTQIYKPQQLLFFIFFSPIFSFFLKSKFEI